MSGIVGGHLGTSINCIYLYLFQACVCVRERETEREKKLRVYLHTQATALKKTEMSSGLSH